jgi:hypothetical protein
MRHADFKDAVAARFEDEHGDAPLSKQLSLRCQVARDMLAEEPEEVKARLKKENEEAHTPEMEEYENSEQGLPSVDPEVQAE